MLLVSLKNALFGTAKVKIPASSLTNALNICMKYRLPYLGFEQDGENAAFKMSLFSYRRLSAYLTESKIEHSVKIGGLPALFMRYGKRYGLLAGLLISAVLIHTSGQTVWDVRVTGNKLLTESDVERELRAAGFGVGCRKNERDVDEISNEVLLASDDIAWLSINYLGSIANVQIREKQKEGDSVSAEPSNIVASRDGIIDRVSVLRGRAAVTEGDAVREGELLISGVVEDKHGGDREEAALGEVFAVTNRVFEIKIPLKYEETKPSKPILIKKSLNFFGKNIIFYKKNCNSEDFCVTIKRENVPPHFGLPSLPVSVVSEYGQNEEKSTLTRSGEKASELAFFELNKRLASELPHADILKKDIKTDVTDTEVVLICEIVCSENIAKSVPFTSQKN